MQRTKHLHKVNQQVESWNAAPIWLLLDYCCHETHNITNSNSRCCMFCFCLCQTDFWVITSPFFVFFSDFTEQRCLQSTHHWVIVWLYVSCCVPLWCKLTAVQQVMSYKLMAAATGEWHKTDQFWLRCIQRYVTWTFERGGIYWRQHFALELQLEDTVRPLQLNIN